MPLKLFNRLIISSFLLEDAYSTIDSIDFFNNGKSFFGINVLPSSVVNDLQVSGTGSFYSVGVGTTTPSYPLHVIGTVSSTTGYNIGATAGFTGTGTYTNFTIIGGIIVSAS